MIDRYPIGSVSLTNIDLKILENYAQREELGISNENMWPRKNEVGFPAPHTTHHIYQKILSPPPSKDSQILNIFTTATTTVRIGVIIISCLIYPISLQNYLLLPSLPFQYILNTAFWNILFNVCHFRSLFCSKTQQHFVIPRVKHIPETLTTPIRAFMICQLLSLFSSTFRHLLSEHILSRPP